MFKNFIVSLRQIIAHKRRMAAFPNSHSAIETWHDFIMQADWRDVIYLKEHSERVFNGYSYRANQINSWFMQRLTSIEFPIVREAKLSDEKIIYVNENDGVEAIKKKVCLEFDGSPAIVLEKGGRLRGFAISEKLIIAGVAQCGTFPKLVYQRASEQGLKLLSAEDARLTEDCLAVLNRMMKKAEVPTLVGVRYWLLDFVPSDSLMLATWDFRISNRDGYIEEDDLACLLAKW